MSALPRDKESNQTDALTLAVPPARLVEAVTSTAGRYRVTLATSARQLRQTLNLRFRVFNLELDEGLEASFANELDQDEFDRQCHHLVVEDQRTDQVVGTYRLQSAAMASHGCGFYSAAEFELEQLDADIVSQSIELGRACIDEAHRNTRVLFALWRGLATYMQAAGLRYFFGCCSLTSQDPAEGHALFRALLEDGHADAKQCIDIMPAFRCPTAPMPHTTPEIPKLMAMYLAYGARIVSGPALDREFGTIDFLALFDLASLSDAHRKLFLVSHHES
ncbi:MAG: GNAT family N-acyltransferase [Pseudomonadota bacterium]